MVSGEFSYRVNVSCGHTGARDRGCHRRTAAGFTLVELVVTMIVIGILAFVAMPRFADKTAFEARGFRDETLSLLRYAQKSAVAQRRTVCVAIVSTGITLRFHTSEAPTGTCAGGTLTLPATPRGGSGLGGSDLSFLASGCAMPASGTGCASGTLTLTVANADNIQVDAATGYVR